MKWFVGNIGKYTGFDAIAHARIVGISAGVWAREDYPTNNTPDL